MNYIIPAVYFVSNASSLGTWLSTLLPQYVPAEKQFSNMTKLTVMDYAIGLTRMFIISRISDGG